MRSRNAETEIDLTTTRLSYATLLRVLDSPIHLAQKSFQIVMRCSIASLFLIPLVDCHLSTLTGQDSLNNPSEILPAPLQEDQIPEDLLQNQTEVIPQDQDPRNILMSGPMHEAFLEVHQADPTPNAIIEKQPPEPIDELPPEYKPEGLNVQWIPGYWGWDFEKEDFVWVSGVWRDIPPDRTWIPGYWHAVENGLSMGFRLLASHN